MSKVEQRFKSAHATSETNVSHPDNTPVLIEPNMVTIFKQRMNRTVDSFTGLTLAEQRAGMIKAMEDLEGKDEAISVIHQADVIVQNHKPKSSEITVYAWIGHKSKLPGKEELEKLYQDYSMEEIGVMFGVSYQRVAQKLHKYGIPTRPFKPRKKEFDQDELKDLYEDAKLSVNRIARSKRVSFSTIYKRLKDAYVKMRDTGGVSANIPKDELERLYETMTQEELANYFNVTKGTIYRRMKKYGLKARKAGTRIK